MNEVELKLSEEAAAILLNLIAAIERLAAAFEQGKRAEREKAKPVYLEGNGE